MLVYVILPSEDVKKMGVSTYVDLTIICINWYFILNISSYTTLLTN